MPRSVTKGRYRARATTQHVGLLPTEIPLSLLERNHVPPIGGDGMVWYACTCAPQRERAAGYSLRRDAQDRGLPALRTYAPCATDWVRRKRGRTDGPRRQVQTPLLRSYLFVGACGGLIPEHLALMSERDFERRNRHGLGGILGAHGKPLPLSDGAGDARSDVAFLARLAAAEREAFVTRVVTGSYEPGDRVEAADGPFTSYAGSVTAVDEVRGRLIAEFTIFGRATPIELDFADVRKAA